MPHELRLLADLYPRETWQAHSNFSALTAFWLDRHLMFRRVLDQLLSDTRGFLDGNRDPQRYGALLSRYTGHFLDGLHGHHMIEDHHYFPLLSPLDARLVRAFDLLDSDHQELTGLIHGLADGTNAVLRPLQAGDTARTAAGTLHAAQETFRRFLDRHLNDEEEVVVPIILEYGPDIA